MIWLQIIVTIFIILVLLKLFKQRQADKLTVPDFLIWLFLWLVVLIVFWQPETTSYLANWLGIGRGADLVVYLAIIFIFYLLFRIFIRQAKIEKDITKLVSDDAIRNAKKR